MFERHVVLRLVVFVLLAVVGIVVVVEVCVGRVGFTVAVDDGGGGGGGGGGGSCGSDGVVVEGAGVDVNASSSGINAEAIGSAGNGGNVESCGKENGKSGGAARVVAAVVVDILASGSLYQRFTACMRRSLRSLPPPPPLFVGGFSGSVWKFCSFVSSMNSISSSVDSEISDRLLVDPSQGCKLLVATSVVSVAPVAASFSSDDDAKDESTSASDRCATIKIGDDNSAIRQLCSLTAWSRFVLHPSCRRIVAGQRRAEF